VRRLIHSRAPRWLVALLVVGLIGAGVAAWRRDGAAPPGSASVTGAPRPRVEGNRLVDDRTGDDFVPKGVNWSSFEYACAQGWGMSAIDGLAAAGQVSTEARAIAEWGVDTVRLPLNQDCWLGTRDAPVSDSYQERTPTTYREQVREFVDALHDQGIVVILDLHSRKRPDSPEFGNLAMPDTDSLAFWRSVAADYRDDPSVMFDAFIVPYSRFGPTGELVFDLTWSCWRDGGCAAPAVDDRTATSGAVTYQVQGMAAVVAAIRDAGADQPILLGGLDYANDLSQWLAYAPDDDQLVAAFHSYDFKPCSTHECWDTVIGPLADSVPVLTSELGATDPLGGYVSDYLDWAGDHGIGALLWVWADNPSDPMALVTDESGVPTAYGQLARSWLGAPVYSPDSTP
jgi:hypothetical protein